MTENQTINISVKKLSTECLAETREHWQRQAGDEEFETEYGFVFDTAKGRINYDDPEANTLVYGLFENDSHIASALLEVIQSARSPRNSVTKLLKLWASPEYWDVARHQKVLAKITVAALKGTLELSRRNHSKTVKIFGRTEQMLSVLYSVHLYMQESLQAEPNQGFEVRMEGRWLVFVLSDQSI